MNCFIANGIWPVALESLKFVKRYRTCPISMRVWRKLFLVQSTIFIVSGMHASHTFAPENTLGRKNEWSGRADDFGTLDLVALWRKQNSLAVAPVAGFECALRLALPQCPWGIHAFFRKRVIERVLPSFVGDHVQFSRKPRKFTGCGIRHHDDGDFPLGVR